jgi:hypothetical protein
LILALMNDETVSKGAHFVKVTAEAETVKGEPPKWFIISPLSLLSGP